MTKYRRKPIVVDAVLFKPGMEESSHCGFLRCVRDEKDCLNCDDRFYYIKMFTGRSKVDKGDYVLTDQYGNRYPIAPTRFKEDYEKVSLN